MRLVTNNQKEPVPSANDTSQNINANLATFYHRKGEKAEGEINS